MSRAQVFYREFTNKHALSAIRCDLNSIDSR